MNLDNEVLVSEILTNYFTKFLNDKIGICTVKVKFQNIISNHSYVPEHYIYCSIGMNNQIYEITSPPITNNHISLETFNQKNLSKYAEITSIISIFERYLIQNLDKVLLNIKLDLLTLGD